MENFLVFTIAARGREFHFQREYLLENYLRLKNKYPNLNFCVVAGHPAYKSVDKSLPSTEALQNIFTRIRNISNSIIFFGIENIATHIVQQIIIQYESVIPFLLHGDNRIFTPNKLMSPIAVYSPITHSIPDKEAIHSLLGYLYRRRETRQALTRRGYFLFPPMNWNDLVPEVQTILYISFQKHVLTQQNYKSRIESFGQNGVQLVIGYPALLKHFLSLVKQFKIETIQYVSKW